jgi:hypothetical protein
MSLKLKIKILRAKTLYYKEEKNKYTIFFLYMIKHDFQTWFEVNLARKEVSMI